MQKLKEQWYFNCSCPRCADESEFGTWTSSISCPSCSRKDDQQRENMYLSPVLSVASQESDDSLQNVEKISTKEEQLLFVGKCGHR